MTELRKVDAYAGTRPAVVELLRECLARAEAGEYRSVHIFAFRTDGMLQTQAAGEFSITDTVAALEVYKHRVLHVE